MYLDEFERRNPKGFAAWLASGARTLPYLTPATPRRPHQDRLGRTDPRNGLMSASRSELGRATPLRVTDRASPAPG